MNGRKKAGAVPSLFELELQVEAEGREKLCFTATATGTYAEASAVAAKWGLAVEDSSIHQLVQQVANRRSDGTPSASSWNPCQPNPGAGPVPWPT